MNIEYRRYIYFCVAIFFLTFFGLIMVFSSSAIDSMTRNRSPFLPLLSETLYVVVGFLGFIIASRIKTITYIKWSKYIYGAALAACLLVLTPLGITINGNRNWLNLGFATVQPSEFLKLSLILWLGLVLSKRIGHLDKLAFILIPGGIGAAVGFGVVMLGGDLGTAIILVLIIASAYAYAGTPTKYMVVASLIGGAALLVTFVLGSSNRMERVVAAYGDCQGHEEGFCYQTIHGLYALATGGLFGVGPGASREKWNYLPEANNDFIFSVIGEEFGVIGTFLVLGIFIFLLYATYRIILNLKSKYQKLVSASIIVWIIGQALINMAIVVRLLPVMGVPLPLISSGGSSLIATLLSLGVIASFARESMGRRQGVIMLFTRFRKPKLKEAKLKEAKLREVKLREAKLRETKLKGVKI
ncbi:MAG: FtsW/RodA/SpoVE family cell cycle protein [Bifidobacteriaceae bacterium]|nr:FtsW/RodA/SpoVE family cell cycle protein [Bifidobacteriaceae bacterium]